ncbi:DUF4249 domain-containing protein [bacterium]|nr:DUF4249 domain-containing protein [bacterium]
MKYYILFLSTFLILFSSCEDVIDVTLPESESQIVVDAWLTNLEGRQVIKLTTTQPYFDNTLAEGIDNAIINISNNNGTNFSFTSEGNGVYTHALTAEQTFGEVGDEFTLDINVNNQNLTSTTLLNDVPAIDSLSQEFKENEPFVDDGIYCEFFARDLLGLGNSYWIKSFKNDTFLNRPSEINIAFDASFDAGGEVDNLIFIPPIRDNINPNDDDGGRIPWIQGDKLRVEIHSISNMAFSFLETTRDQLLNSQSGIFASPLANTRGNIINETNDDIILGVFNIAQVSSRELEIQ